MRAVEALVQVCPVIFRCSCGAFGRPVSRRPAGSTLWKSVAFGSSRMPMLAVFRGRAPKVRCIRPRRAVRHELPEAGQGGDRSPPAADSGLRRHRAYVVDTPDPLGELAVEPPPRL